VTVDPGRLDFAAQPERFPGFNTPDESYHGLVYARDLGVGSPLGANLAFILKARAEGQRDLGFALAPHSAFLIAQGIETLSLRMERHVDNALAVATWLEGRDDVASVRYSGLTSSPYYERHRKYCPRGAGSILTFDLAGGREAGAAFIDALSLFSNLANIGDVRSLAIHPATTTHSQLDDAGLAAAGITAGTVRLSVAVAFIGSSIIGLATLLLLQMTNLSLDRILFEVISAFATVGLSTGITPSLPDGAKYVIVALMFVGRVGTMTAASALALRERRRVIRMPEASPMIG